MTTQTSSGFLRFSATVNGNSLSIDSSTFDGGTGGLEVTDASSDGDADTGTPPEDGLQDSGGGLPYSGFTINISGNSYAVFGPVLGLYVVPYFNAVADLSGLIGQSTTGYVVTQSGNNANVVNLCFASGTLIATPDGECAVEALSIGDDILTADGRITKVKWIGVQDFTLPVNMRHGEPRAPVVIAAGTLGTHTDLCISADHGMIVDGLVINAGALVNGTTVKYLPVSEMPAQFTYYHVETENHEVILANGAAAESFIDYTGRQQFDNYHIYLALYGDDRTIAEMPRPRLSAARLVPAGIKARVADADIATDLTGAA